MWSHLYVGPNQWRGLSHLHRLYLQRAGSKTPLSLRLHLPYRYVDYDRDYEVGICRLLKELFRFPGRFARLELHLSAKELALFRDLRLMDKGLGFKLLETLSLALDCHFDEEITFPDDFLSAPLLRAIDLVDERGNSFDFLEGKLPWHQLEHVTTNLRDLSILDDLKHLDDSEDLSERTMHWNCVASGMFAGDVTPNVTSLVLSSHIWTNGLVGFLEECHMPALQNLTLEETPHETTLWINVLAALPLVVEKSAHGLRTLSIILSNEYEVGDQALDLDLAHDLEATLKCTPTLQTLQVVESTSGVRILTQELFDGIQRRGLVPNLKHIELVWSQSHAIPEDSVLEMLARQAGEGLESVVLGVRKGGDVPKRVRDFVQQQRTDGLRANLW